MDWKTLFLSPRGRIRRRDFWMGFFLVMIASAVINVIPLFGPPLGLVMLWPQVCIHAKRLHDMGRSALLMLIPLGLILATAGIATASGGMDMTADHSTSEVTNLVFASGVGLVGLSFLLWVGLSRGEPGPNRFGSPPEPRTR